MIRWLDAPWQASILVEFYRGGLVAGRWRRAGPRALGRAWDHGQLTVACGQLGGGLQRLGRQWRAKLWGWRRRRADGAGRERLPVASSSL
eukprot:10220778-Alexandrium_andersonii.AAC.1